MLLSIDPGINNTGIAVIDYTADFTVIKTLNVSSARKLSVEEKLTEAKHGLRVVKINFILQTVKALLLEYKDIDHVCIEAPFYSPLTPMAYGSLVEIISAIKYVLLVPQGYSFNLMEPLLVKRAFINIKLGKDMKKKQVMREFLEKKVLAREIVLNVTVESLTEHEIDAIAIGYTQAIATLLIKEDLALAAKTTN